MFKVPFFAATNRVHGVTHPWKFTFSQMIATIIGQPSSSTTEPCQISDSQFSITLPVSSDSMSPADFTTALPRYVHITSVQ